MSDAAAGKKEFGSCCAELKEVLGSSEFEPMIAVGEDQILYMSVGMADGEEDGELNMVDHPMFYCPFCGTHLQTVEEVEAKTAPEDDQQS